MKQVKFCTALAVIILIGCTKSNDGLYTDNEWRENNLTNRSILAEIAGIKNLQSQKVAYTLLSADQKAEAWRQHLALFLRSKSLPEHQRSLVTKFKKTIDAEVFITKESGQDFLATQQMTELIYTITKSFSKEEIFKIFGTLNEPETSNVDPGGNSCNCNYEHDFCEGSSIHCYKNMNNCGTSSTGCGWLWLQSCDGRCGAGL